MNAPSTNTALVALEQQLQPLAPRFEAALAGQIPVDRLIRTILMSVERLPALLNCDRQSIFNAAMSAAVLGLEVDGVTGQAFLIPYGNKAQLVIGYRGYNTLAARAGLTITGGIVREGDAFEYEKGSGAYVRHKPLLEGTEHRRIVGAWACASHADRPPVVEVMGIDEILAVKEKSPGAKRRDSPWNDQKVGFPAMAEKTAKRRLARSLPMSIMQMASRMDSAVDEEGKPAYITPERGLEIDGHAEPATPYEHSPTPEASRLLGRDMKQPDGPAAELEGERTEEETATEIPVPNDGSSGSTEGPSIEDYERYVVGVINKTETAVELGTWWNSQRQKDERRNIGNSDRMTDLIARVSAEIARRQEPVA